MYSDPFWKKRDALNHIRTVEIRHDCKIEAMKKSELTRVEYRRQLEETKIK